MYKLNKSCVCVWAMSAVNCLSIKCKVNQNQFKIYLK